MKTSPQSWYLLRIPFKAGSLFIRVSFISFSPRGVLQSVPLGDRNWKVFLTSTASLTSSSVSSWPWTASTPCSGRPTTTCRPPTVASRCTFSGSWIMTFCPTTATTARLTGLSAQCTVNQCLLLGNITEIWKRMGSWFYIMWHYLHLFVYCLNLWLKMFSSINESFCEPVLYNKLVVISHVVKL